MLEVSPYQMNLEITILGHLDAGERHSQLSLLTTLQKLPEYSHLTEEELTEILEHYTKIGFLLITSGGIERLV